MTEPRGQLDDIWSESSTVGELARAVELYVVLPDGTWHGEAPPGEELRAALAPLVTRVLATGEPLTEEIELAVDGSRRPRWSVVLRATPGGGAAVALQDCSSMAKIQSKLHRYELVQSASREAIWDWNPITGETWWNVRHYELLQYPLDHPASFEAWASRIHPDDRARVLGGFERTVESDAVTWEGEYRIALPDGQEMIVHDRGYIERNESGRPARMIGLLADVTEQREAERSLRESEERFRQIAETVNEVFWLTNREGTRAIYVSPAFEAVYGRPREDVMQDTRNLLRYIHEEDQARVGHAMSLLPQPLDETYRVVRPDGSIAWIRDRAFPVRDAAGQVTRLAGLATNITEQKRLEEQLLQAQKLESIGRLAGGVAHDFNNLLTVILSGVALISRRLPHTGELAEDLEAVREAARRAARLTSQLLSFARKQVVAPTRIDLSAMAREMDQLLRRVIGEHIELVTVLTSDLGPVRADRGQLEQVIMNLLVNARDAMPDGGRVTLETADLVLGPDRDRRYAAVAPGAYVALRVSDQGPGIPPEALPHLFEPFFTTKEVGRGTGLGLATCYGIVQQAGGHILVRSEPGRGATFEVLLPRDSGDGERREASAPEGLELPRGREIVLFVEDDPAVRQVGVRILTDSGYQVIAASSGPEALRLHAAAPHAIDLLVTDVVMPRMSGIELARELRALRPGLRVLYTSGYTDSALVDPALAQPRSAFLPKPYLLDTLLAQVRALLDA